MKGKRPKQDKTFLMQVEANVDMYRFSLCTFLLGLARCPYCLVAPKRQRV